MTSKFAFMAGEVDETFKEWGIGPVCKKGISFAVLRGNRIEINSLHHGLALIISVPSWNPIFCGDVIQLVYDDQQIEQYIITEHMTDGTAVIRKI